MIPLIFAIFASSATFLGVGAVFANNKAGSACGSAEAFQPPQFQDDCRIYESVMALAFALFGICLFLTIAYVYEAFIAKNKKKTAFGAVSGLELSRLGGAGRSCVVCLVQ